MFLFNVSIQSNTYPDILHFVVALIIIVNVTFTIILHFKSEMNKNNESMK